jgi:hypothetical protein
VAPRHAIHPEFLKLDHMTMHKCDHCGTTILFGGVRAGCYRFCKQQCRDAAAFLMAAAELPEAFVAEKVRQLHEGNCPGCHGPGPIDVHTAHSVWSALVITSWRSTRHVCCQSCGTKARVRALSASLLFGWWGIPWGLLITPVQVFRNLYGLFAAPDPAVPSSTLTDVVRRQLADQLMDESSRHQAA